MTPASVALLAWLWSAPQHTAPRRVNTAIAIAEAADETDCPKFWAAILDVFAAAESNYSDEPTVSGGCPGVQIGTPCSGGAYVSPWMLQRAIVPRGSTLVDEARIAIATFRESARECPAYPWGLFVGVGCKQSMLADGRMRSVMAMFANEVAR